MRPLKCQTLGCAVNTNTHFSVFTASEQSMPKVKVQYYACSGTEVVLNRLGYFCATRYLIDRLFQ